MNSTTEVRNLLLAMMSEIDGATTEDQVVAAFNYTVDIITSMIEEKDLDVIDIDNSEDTMYDDVYELMKGGKL